jgi:hypothetical protein
MTPPLIDVTAAGDDTPAPAISAVDTAALLDTFVMAGMLSTSPPQDLIARISEAQDGWLREADAQFAMRKQLIEVEISEVERHISACADDRARAESEISAMNPEFDRLRQLDSQLSSRRAQISTALAVQRPFYRARLQEARTRAETAEVERAIALFKLTKSAPQEVLETSRRDTEYKRVADSERTARVERLRQEMERVLTAQQRAGVAASALEEAGVTRTVAGFLMWSGMGALLITGLGVGAWLASNVSSDGWAAPAIAASVGRSVGLAVAEHGYGSAFWVVALSLAMPVIVTMCFFAGDVLLSHIDARWRHSHQSRTSSQLPASWAGGAGKRVMRGDYLALLRRMPQLAGFCVLVGVPLTLAALQPPTNAMFASTLFWHVVAFCAGGVTAGFGIASLWLIFTMARFGTRKWASIFAPALAAISIACAAVGVATLAVDAISAGDAAAIVAILAAPLTFATGLQCRGTYRQFDVARNLVRMTERSIADACESEPAGGTDASQLADALAEVRRRLDEEWSQILSPIGSIEFIRPTRRFWKTPQVDNTVDKAALEEYSPADALLEPELLHQLFDIRGQLESARDEFERAAGERRQREERIELAQRTAVALQERRHLLLQQLDTMAAAHFGRIIERRSEVVQTVTNLGIAYETGRRLSSRRSTPELETALV